MCANVVYAHNLAFGTLTAAVSRIGSPNLHIVGCNCITSHSQQAEKQDELNVKQFAVYGGWRRRRRRRGGEGLGQPNQFAVVVR